MEIYLVGGAVRDQLLDYPLKERDWVVVGASPAHLLQQGFTQVGRDFPVFLHPQTREEYALARTERKQGSGYYGFTCHFDAQVTLEEDLKRRDLTINAMAMDKHQRVIDPYNGQADLKAKILRHVSSAFIEDPVRLLRVARFVARYHHLGFKLAPETAALLRDMVRAGDLAHLVAERVWQEWHRSLEEKNPEMFLYTLRACGGLKVLFPELDALFGMPSWRKYHQEVDSGVHTLMVLHRAAQLSDDPMVRFAATLHDLGKAKTKIGIWPAQHDHENLGVAPVEALCQRLRVPNPYRQLTVMVVRLHLLIHRLTELRAHTVVEVFQRADAFRRPEWFEKLLMVCLADEQGRGLQGEYPSIPWLFPSQPSAENPLAIHLQQKMQHWRMILDACRQIKTTDLIEAGHDGKTIGILLHEKRAACVDAMRKQLGLKQ